MFSGQHTNNNLKWYNPNRKVCLLIVYVAIDKVFLKVLKSVSLNLCVLLEITFLKLMPHERT